MSAGAICRLGVDLLKIAEHGFPRGLEAVEIEPVKADFWYAHGKLVIVGMQPPDKFDHVGIAPHPSWKALEPIESRDGIRVFAHAAHVAIDAISVRPIGFHRDRREVFFLDEPLRDLGALAIELVRAVGCGAQQHDARVANQVDERVIVPGLAVQRVRGRAYRLYKSDAVSGARWLPHYFRSAHGQRSRISTGNICLMSSISPSVTRCASTKNTARTTTSGSTLSSSLNCCSIRARNCSLWRCLSGLPVGSQPS